MDKCIRCGSNFKIEKHHIVHRVNGGTDDIENKEPRCRHCHKYQHAKELLIDNISRYADRLRYGDFSRDYYIRKLKLEIDRLDILMKNNTVKLIKSRGYYSYWNDIATHFTNKSTDIVPVEDYTGLDIKGKELW